MSALQQHEVSWWVNEFDLNSCTRGATYARQGRVSDCNVYHQDAHTLQITASVLGQRKTPYKVNILLDLWHETLEADCSCPVGLYCKHAAAVMVEVLAKNSDVQQPKVSLTSPLGLSLKHWLSEFTVEQSKAASSDEQVVYILDHDTDSYDGGLLLKVGISRVLKRGGWSKPKAFSLTNALQQKKWDSDDFAILGQLELISHHSSHYFSKGEYPLAGNQAGLLLPLLIKTKRCYWISMKSPPLSWGPSKAAEFEWQMDENGVQKLHARIPESSQTVIPILPLHYIDTDSALIGEVTSELPQQMSMHLLHTPPIPPNQVKNFKKALKKYAREHASLPLPKTFKKIEQIATKPIPHLRIYEEDLPVVAQGSSKTGKTSFKPMIVAECQLLYGDIEVSYLESESQLQRVNGSTIELIQREPSAERVFIEQLHKHEIRSVIFHDDLVDFKHFSWKYQEMLYICPADDIDAIQHFQNHTAAKLSKAGWVIKNDVTEWLAEPVEVESWYSQLNASEDHDWFQLQLGVVVNGETVNLLPQLIELIQHGSLSNDDGTNTLIHLENGKYVTIPSNRLKLIKKAILQFTDPNRQTFADTIKVSRYHAALLAEMNKALKAVQIRWLGQPEVLALGKKLSSFKKLKKTRVPASFNAKLRPYQQSGVDWMQFLREYALNGILADDMGLGKTVQVLANLCIEKQKKRLCEPCLIIAPTSVITNWNRELERFAPSLNCILLQGKERHGLFDKVKNADVVLTSYALIVRDKAILLEHKFYYLILDESHYIKNKQAKITQIVQQIRANHRLCLTGTPVENHLGELWSQFHFLLPGLLGSSREFQQRFRTPIEKQQDQQAQLLLSQLTKPFLLRRTKEKVINELPEKTDIIKTIELSKSQQDLYESIRFAMNKKVKKAIDQKGIERSQIVILDALLKLRQICCDPRLLNIPAAREVQGSSKLDIAISMLTEMVGEGRKILLFSQFTSMLSLIEAELKAREIDYVKLTGRTRNRMQVIDKFQQGTTPVFLISLKAGGTGLNLTAADTIIHYDPWWNPAVEDQATDRAHRIGQKKAVFVYKLITNKTVEEKILAMQTNKRGLSESLFEGKQNFAKFTSRDLDAIFGKDD